MPTTPIIDEGRGYREWHIREIFTGPSGTGKFVPNIDDKVIEWTGGLVTYRVVAVDSLTHLSTLDRVVPDMGGGVLAEDVLLGTGPGMVSESYRVYLNTDNFPITMAFDARLHVYGTAASYVKLFRGNDISSVTGMVVSAIYNLSNAVISENLPLEAVTYAGTPSVAIKTPTVAWCTEPLADGEVVTAVVYDGSDNVLSISRLLAVRTNFVRTADAGRRFILGIELLSPYLSVTDDHLLEYPVNMLLQSGSLQGRVRYSDATEEDLPIDGTRFTLMGGDNFIATELGRTVPLVLKYTLQPNEYAYGISQPGTERFLTETYQLTTVESQNMYSVRLFVEPVWTSTEWVLHYWLYTLDRSERWYAGKNTDPSPLVQISPSTPFDGTQLNVIQNLMLAANLDQIDPGFLYYRYIQNVSIQLKAGGSNTLSTNYWTMEYHDNRFYGSGNYAPFGPDPANPSLKRLDISLNLADETDWLNEMYWPLEPLRLPPLEMTAPTPTHVRVWIGTGWSRELTIAEALQPIDGITAAITQGTSARLEFFQRTVSGDLELALGSITARV